MESRIFAKRVKLRVCVKENHLPWTNVESALEAFQCALVFPQAHLHLGEVIGGYIARVELIEQPLE
jgi:hypothetical protein